jgi:TatD DNase family protein
MELIDSHCHIDVDEFAADRDRVLAECRRLGVTRLVVPAVETATWEHLLQVCRSQPGLYPTLGLHPYYLERHLDDHLQALEQQLALNSDVVAVGEIGLDFYIAELERDRQQQLFEAQLAIARAANLPVILHIRKAHEQVLNTLKRIKVRGGIAHAFNASLEQAQRYIDMGFKLGFGGMLTFERSTRLRALAKTLPLDAIVLETDAPDMPGEPWQHQRNSPAYLPFYLETLAALRGEDKEKVAAVTTANVKSVLSLDQLQ